DSRGNVYVADTRNNTIRTSAPLPTGLAVDFGAPYGIWLRRGTEWRQVNANTAKTMLAISDRLQDALIIDFGPGLGIWFNEKEADGDDGWFQIHSQSADAMAGLDTDANGETD